MAVAGQSARCRLVMSLAVVDRESPFFRKTRHEQTDWKYEKLMVSIAHQVLQIRRLSMKLTAIIEREGDGYVSLCPELDIASQGDSVEQARNNLREALELFFETASPEEKKQRLHEEVFVTQLEVAFG